MFTIFKCYLAISMGCLSSKHNKSVELKQEHVTASSHENALVPVQSHFEAAGDKIPAENYLARLKDTSLLYIIDFDHGLLYELIKLGVINCEKYEPFRVDGLNGNSDSEARWQLMNDVINASSAQKELFLSALDRTQQSHVTNYILHNGQRPSDTDDNWPSFDRRNIINEHIYRLIDLIDIECGLMVEVISAGILNEEQRTTVLANDLPNRSRAMNLMHIMKRKSIADYKKFIDCLVKTKQFRVVSILDSSTAATCPPPLSEDQRAKLDAKYSALVRLIDIRHSGLLAELHAVDCLTFWQREFIESADVDSARTRRLLDIVRRGSQSDYDKFILCLGRTGQQHVANILLKDTAVVVSQITAHGTAVDNYQRYVVEAFMDILQKSTEDSGQKLLIQASSALGPDNVLIFMKTTESITLFIASYSLSGIQYPNEMYLNTQLKNLIQAIFRELLENTHDVIIDELIWNRSDYNRNVQHMSKASGLSVCSKIYHLASDITKELPICSSSIDVFPHELIEVTLMKVAGQLFVRMKAITTNASTQSLVTVSAVCRYWWETLTCRRSNTRRLRRYFTQLCRPFKFNPRLVNSLQTVSKRVYGVVAFDGKLYVACHRSNTIGVYNLADSSSQDLIERFEVPGLLDPSDMVVCSSTCFLFVSDVGTHCIWRVNLLSVSKVVDQTDQSPFIANLQYMPCRLSVQFERLLVAPYAGDTLYVYNINDVERSQRINLPDYMLALHAVETSRGTFVVAHDSKWNDDLQSDHTGVSELSADGHVLRVYKGPATFHVPFYITTVNGHFLVSDRFNRNTLHLNRDLELTQVLLADFHMNPWRQCCSVETGKLYVTFENSDTVNFYNV